MSSRLRCSSLAVRLRPCEVYELEVDIWDTGNLFKAGHRVRLQVSNSHFPRYGRNLNTMSQPGHDTEMAVAHQTIFHDAARPSYLTLPVMPG